MLDSEENCKHCLGWGLMYTAETGCPTCGGKVIPSHLRCTTCFGRGVIVKVAPLHEEVPGDQNESIPFSLTDEVPADSLKEALTLLRVGYEETEPVDPKVLGRLAVLLDMSADLDGTPLKDWLKEDRIVFEPSGVWVVRGDQACRVHEYEVKHV